MFDQMLLPGTHTHQGRCAAFAFAGELGIAVIASLFLTISDVVPIRAPEIVSPLFLAPPPPPAAPPVAPRTPQPVRAAPRVVARTFTAPVLRNMPQHAMVIVDPEPAAPDAPVAGAPGGVPGGVPGGSLNGLMGSLAIIGPPIPQSQPKPAPAPTVPTAPRRITVGGEVEDALLTHEVDPKYPALAKSYRIQGDIKFSAVIATDGTVKNLRLISGNPLLVDAAREAVMQWVYRPTFLDGQPAEVLTDITVQFKLR